MNRPQSQGVTEINAVTQKIIGHAIEVHRVLGPGLLETIYEAAMCIEFDDAGVKYERQTRVPAYYKGRLLGEYRVDLEVDDLVLVEVKSIERLNPVFEAQLLTYLTPDRQTDRIANQFQLPLTKGWRKAHDLVGVGPASPVAGPTPGGMTPL